MSSPDTPSFAIIDGSLCRLSRRGTVTKRHAPLGLAIEQFIVDEGRVYVREKPEGLLEGIPSVYCLDDRLQLVWLASQIDPREAIVGEITLERGIVSGETRAGHRLKLAADSGKPFAVQTP